MNQFKLTSPDKTQINVTIWDEVDSPKAIIQISHGMAEYGARYDAFAIEMNKNGYIVVASDHRGHGLTSGYDNRGITSGDSFNDSVEDLAMVTGHVAYKYNLPVILLGHSYGSFLAQAYIEKHGSLIEGVILSGSAYMNTAQVKMGGCIAGMQKALCGEAKPARLIEKLSFGSYNKPFEKEGKFAWLSRDLNSNSKYVKDDFCGFTMCLGFQASFLKNVSKLYGEEKLNAIPKTLPILILSGDNDPVGSNGKMTTKLYQTYKDFKLNAQIKLYEGARHEILNETNKKEVYADILAFADKCLKI